MDEKLERLLTLVRGLAHEIAGTTHYEDDECERLVRDYIEERAELIEVNIDKYMEETHG